MDDADDITRKASEALIDQLGADISRLIIDHASRSQARLKARIAELDAANAMALKFLRERYAQDGKWHDGRAQQVAIDLAAAAA